MSGVAFSERCAALGAAVDALALPMCVGRRMSIDGIIQKITELQLAGLPGNTITAEYLSDPVVIIPLLAIHKTKGDSYYFPVGESENGSSKRFYSVLIKIQEGVAKRPKRGLIYFLRSTEVEESLAKHKLYHEMFPDVISQYPRYVVGSMAKVKNYSRGSLDIREINKATADESERVVVVKRLICHLAEKMQQVHEAGYAFGDIKLENFVLQDEHTPTTPAVLFCDVGSFGKEGDPGERGQLTVERDICDFGWMMTALVQSCISIKLLDIKGALLGFTRRCQSGAVTVQEIIDFFKAE